MLSYSPFHFISPFSSLFFFFFFKKGVPEQEYRGKWKAVTLNETFRICKYTKGGYFFPHFDGGFDRGVYNRSIQTFMLYLNDGFEGGNTNFFREEGEEEGEGEEEEKGKGKGKGMKRGQRHYMPPREEEVVKKVRGRSGMALIFNSQLLHDGGVVEGGEKYIMRSEIMYRKLKDQKK